MAPRITCEQTTTALRAYILKTLPGKRNVAVEEHLGGCAACRQALDRERERLAVLDARSSSDVPEGLADRTLARISGAAVAEAPRPRRWVLAGAMVAAMVVFVGVLLPVLSRSREAARRSSTQGNMKQLGLVFKMYANESDGALWPKLAMNTDAWVPELSPLREKFLSDPACLVSEQHPEAERLKRALRAVWESPEGDLRQAERLMGESFGYMGYLFEDNEDFEAALRAEAAPGTAPQPLREGVERFLITDINNPAGTTAAQSNVPVLIEIATWKHTQSLSDYRGANVLFMDGHVEFVPLGTFPVLPSVLNTLSGMNTSAGE